MTRRKCLLLIALGLLAPMATLVGVLSLRPGVYLPAHQHCIKMAGMEMHRYAADHDGRLPSHPEGYGNALLLLGEDSWPMLTGPGYDVQAFHRARAGGRGLAEDDCGRVYVQGLHAKSSNTSELVILFDKLSTPGGDHCHLPARLWASRCREVLYVDGHVNVIGDDRWPAFAAEQINLLVAAGIPRAEAERLYGQAQP